eukprot:17570-Amphidinium_carterae.1
MVDINFCQCQGEGALKKGIEDNYTATGFPTFMHRWFQKLIYRPGVWTTPMQKVVARKKQLPHAERIWVREAMGR